MFLLTGTDEHGQKIEEKAAALGISPQQHVDNIAGEIRRIWDFMNVSYDKFIRTTDPDHTARVQKIFKRLYEQGDIYKGSYEGLYCVPCESFFTESQAAEATPAPTAARRSKRPARRRIFSGSPNTPTGSRATSSKTPNSSSPNRAKTRCSTTSYARDCRICACRAHPSNGASLSISSPNMSYTSG